jgi:hypothetical protein
MKVFVIAHISDELQQPFLQHVRNFDTAHPGCHFEIGLEGPDIPMKTMVERLLVEPELTFTKIFDRAKKDCCRQYVMGLPLCDDCPAGADRQKE